MFYSRLINKAIDLAYSVHKEQTDKAGRPYFLHPVTVAMKMDTEAEICAALLHDTVEDSSVTLEEIGKIFPQAITEAVDVLTHKDGTSYEDYVRSVKLNPIARKVKLADLEHNLDVTRVSDNPELLRAFESRKVKYERAREILLGGQS